jgi:predicted Zn-dependent protease
MKYFLVIILSLFFAGCQSPPGKTVSTVPQVTPQVVTKPIPTPDYDKPVDVWLVPVLGFPDAYTKDLVARLIEDDSIHVRSSVDAGISDSLFFPDNKQMIAEKALIEFSRILSSLSNAKSTTVYIFLTDYDLNGEDRRFRFLFAQNNSQSRMAIISIARLRLNQDGPHEVPSITKLRLFKMTKRQIGELYYGYDRNTDPSSVMYSPLMGLAEIDMIGTKY